MIISFYSYKGGVGRTQLCANIAAYLSIYKNKKILLWDWDFEAPGLHVYFDKTNEEIVSKGTIELLSEYVRTMRSRNIVIQADLPYLTKEYITTLIPESIDGGRIDLLPAGNYSDNFTQNVINFNWQEFYELLDGVTYIELLKKQLNNLDYDYIFIDSRTGISDYSGICNIQLPELTVVVITPNEQNFNGSTRIAKQIVESNYVKENHRKPWVLPIFSRLDLSNKSYPIWIKRFTDDFSYLLHTIDPEINEEFFTEIFQDIYINRTLLEYNTAISTGENRLFNNSEIPILKVSFERKYVNIAQFIENMKTYGMLNVNSQIDSDTWLNYAIVAKNQQQIKKEIIAYQNAGDFRKANELGGTALSWLSQGDEHLNKRELDFALSCFQKSIEIKPDNYDSFYKLAVTYGYKGDAKNEIDNYKKAIEIMPKKYEAWYNIGIAYAKNGMQNESFESMNKYYELGPFDNQSKSLFTHPLKTELNE
jgi:MinD-like ATPase involved in chromosome partitioning or flagellar assembly